MNHKKLIATIGILSIAAAGVYAATTSSIITQMKAPEHSFILASELNNWESGLSSAALKGKKTGDILTAKEYNRILELLSTWSSTLWESARLETHVQEITTSGWASKTYTCPNDMKVLSVKEILVPSGSSSCYSNTSSNSQSVNYGFCNPVTGQNWKLHVVCWKIAWGSEWGWGSGSTSTIIPWWPDAIVCSTNNVSQVFYIRWQKADSVSYSDPLTHNGSWAGSYWFELKKSDGSWLSWGGGANFALSNCLNKNLSEMQANNQAIYFNKGVWSLKETIITSIVSGSISNAWKNGNIVNCPVNTSVHNWWVRRSRWTVGDGTGNAGWFYCENISTTPEASIQARMHSQYPNENAICEIWASCR